MTVHPMSPDLAEWTRRVITRSLVPRIVGTRLESFTVTPSGWLIRFGSLILHISSFDSDPTIQSELLIDLSFPRTITSIYPDKDDIVLRSAHEDVLSIHLQSQPAGHYEFSLYKESV